jgi:uncharacterized protein (DUF362 family)
MATISIWQMPPGSKAQDISEEIAKMSLPFGGLDSFIGAGDHVLLWPTEGGSMESTALEVVEGMALAAIAAGAVRVDIIGESYDAIAKALGGEAINPHLLIAEPRLIPKPLAAEEINIYSRLLQTDVLINMPKFLERDRQIYGNAAYHLLSALPKQEQERLGEWAAARLLCDLIQAISPVLTVMDGSNANRFQRKKTADFLLLGSDMVAVDAVSAVIAGIDIRELPYIELATIHGLGTGNPADITINGADLRN